MLRLLLDILKRGAGGQRLGNPRTPGIMRREDDVGCRKSLLLRLVLGRQNDAVDVVPADRLVGAEHPVHHRAEHEGAAAALRVAPSVQRVEGATAGTQEHSEQVIDAIAFGLFELARNNPRLLKINFEEYADE